MRGRVVAAALALAACSSPSGPTPSQSPTLGPRIASTASVAIAEPQAGAVVPAGNVHVRIALTGGTVTPDTSTDLKPDLGHLHLKLDGSLVSMNYTTESDLDVSAGTHLVEVEFVALDHGPFSPRVLSSTTFKAQ